MTYRGKFTKGTVVLPPDVDIAEGAEVEVTAVPPPPSAAETGDGGPTLYETLKEFVGMCDGLPPDLAENHDHYLHGLPKKRQ